MGETRTTLLVQLRDRTNQEAWQTFDRLYRPMIVGYARSRGLTQADAEDVAQQCIQAVLKQIDDYQHLGSFRTWLRSITEKRICDLYRCRREAQLDSGVLAQKADLQPGPPEVWEKHWWAAHLRHCVESVRCHINKSTYDAFMAYAIEGKPAADVARSLGLSVNQVYVAKHRMIDRIRSLMLDLTGTDDIEAMEVKS